MKHFAVLFAVLLGLGSAQAQTWPVKSIHVVVPYAAGGAMDLTARSLAAVIARGSFAYSPAPGFKAEFD